MNREKELEVLKDNKWKNKDEQYLFELQKFLDLTDNIDNLEFRRLIISQMLKCEKSIVNIAEEMYKKLFKSINENVED